MKALVVYESLFGNTEQVALAVTGGLSKHGEVELIEVTDAPAVITETLDLLVLGGPTHAFSMTRPSTREDAFRQGATQGSTTVGLREWLEHLLTGPHSELVATFDTRGWPRFVICQARLPRVPQRSRSGSVMRRPRRPRASLSRPSVARCWRASWVVPKPGGNDWERRPRFVPLSEVSRECEVRSPPA